MKNRIIELFLTAGIHLSEQQSIRFTQYLELLQSWNERMNLVASSETDEIIMRHFIDSLSILNAVQLTEGLKVIDVGSGAGFPGIPLAIMTNAYFTLVDSQMKRINFLNEVRTVLELENVDCIQSRFEDLAHIAEHREKYDIAVCRAVAPLNVLLEFTLPFIKNNGSLIAHKGSMLPDEVKDSKTAMKLLNGEIEDIYEYTDDKDIKRFILKVKKLNTISKKYPRKSGTPKSSPLL